MAKGEERRNIVRVIPAVADVQTFGIDRMAIHSGKLRRGVRRHLIGGAGKSDRQPAGAGLTARLPRGNRIGRVSCDRHGGELDAKRQAAAPVLTACDEQPDRHRGGERVDVRGGVGLGKRDGPVGAVPLRQHRRRHHQNEPAWRPHQQATGDARAGRMREAEQRRSAADADKAERQRAPAAAPRHCALAE